MLGELSKARAKARRRGGEKWEWVIKPGDKVVVSKTAVIPSKKLSRRDFKVLEEVVNIYIARCLEMCFPTHLGILSRATTGLRMRSTTS
jgi:hypothetical protein